MEAYFMEFEITLEKLNHEFEYALDVFGIHAMEIANNKKCGYITESSMANALLIEEAAKFVESVKKFFKDLVTAIQKLIHDTSVKFSTMIQQKRVNAKLKEIKKLMVKDRSAATEKVECFDSEAYAKALTQYINFAIGQYKKLYSKNYESIEDYQNALESYTQSIENKCKELKINDADGYNLSMYVEKAVTMTEKEVNSMHSIIRAEEKAWDDFVKTMENFAVKSDNSQLVSSIESETNKMSRTVTGGLKKIFNGAANTISGIIRKIGSKLKKVDAPDGESSSEEE